ncbi:hypothetical protein NSA23_03685 [Anaerosalibacter massiliensis]|uniref:Uncharacterized protein n=1 Tax=Anaerosalibacter massiliensis TaxID=1347392 RepID=A0A9X2S4F6_9FIRM|nr:hypothetical protein [Anaerosalibacter massiliensis]MCR2043214.1 hypothetical protein [Anaerosalibacter massiliensis]
MYKEEIKLEIKKLRQELEDNEAEYEDIQDEIESLAYQIDCLESDKYRLENIGYDIENKIEELEKQLASKRFDELDNELTRDKFRDSFIKASYFCAIDEERETLNHVKIEEERLIATDGCRGIIVKCDEIPEGLKNTFVKWDIRQDFNENAKLKGWQTINLDEVIKNGKSNTVFKIEVDEFIESLYFQTIKSSSPLLDEAVILKAYGRKVAFNKRYVDEMLKVFEGKYLKVYWPKSSLNPLIVENGGQQVILLPIRIPELVEGEKDD